MEDRHRLRVIGITYNQIESGVYALILQDDSGATRIPIIIGYPEAQSIECKLQDIATPRPLTHDILTRILEEFDMRLTEVEIRKLPNGVFAADLIIEDRFGQQKKIDSRSSDAVALALRCDAPIYTSAKVIEEAGFTSDGNEASTTTPKTAQERRKPVPDNPTQYGITSGTRTDDSALRRMNDTELERAMRQAVEKEDYESAGLIKAEIDRRKNGI